MTHEKLVTEFLKQNLQEGDLVELIMNNGDKATGLLSDKRVFCDLGENGEKLNSRIGLLPPPPPPGRIAPNIPTTVYTERIITITKIQ